MFVRNVINFSSALMMEAGDSSHTSTTSYQITYDVIRAVFLIGPVVKTKRLFLFRSSYWLNSDRRGRYGRDLLQSHMNDSHFSPYNQRNGTELAQSVQ
jgi:hypothetical protein